MSSPEQGFHIGVLGLDGIGKSSLVKTLREQIEITGRQIEIVSWGWCLQRLPALQEEDEVTSSLEDLWVDSFGTYYAGAEVEGEPVVIPRSKAEIEANGGTKYLADAEVSGVVPTGPVASALLELSAKTLLHQQVIRRLVNKGVVVIDESYGYKSVFRALILARSIEPRISQQVERIRVFARDIFGQVLTPDLGILLDGSPELAVQWRLAQAGGFGPFETLAPSGEDPESSFIRLGGLMRAEFSEFASLYGWETFQISSAPMREQHFRIVNALARGPLRSFLNMDDGMRLS